MSTPEPEPTPLAAPAPPGARRRSRVTIAIATVGVVLAGTFGIIALANSGGSKDPDDAVRDLFSAIDQEDAIGVLGSLDPGERDTLQPAVEDMVTELQRVDVLSDGGSGGSGGGSGSSAGDGPKVDLDDVSGVDLSVKDLELHTTRLGDDVSSVEVTGGTVAVNALVDELPLGPLVREVIAEQDVRNETDTTSADLDGLRLVTVRDDDGWHVSLLYTLGELLRHEIDPQPPIPRYGHGTPATGASSPEEAVRQGVAAATALDLEKLISLTPADGLEALHDYGPTFAAAVAGNESGVTIEDLQLADQRRRGRQEGRHAHGVHDDLGRRLRRTTFAHADGCTTVTYTDVEGAPGGDDFVPKPQKLCGRDDPYGSAAGLLGVPLVGSADELGIVTEQHDGKWFISPTATVVDSVVGALRATTREDARRIVWAYSGRFWLLYPDDFWKACGVEAPPLDATMAEGERAMNQCFEKLPDDYTGFGGSPFLYGSFASELGPTSTRPRRRARPRTPRSRRRSSDASTRPTGTSEMDACFDLLDDPEAGPPVPSGTTSTTTFVPAQPTVPPSTLIPPTTAPASTSTAPPPTTSAPTTTVRCDRRRHPRPDPAAVSTGAAERRSGKDERHGGDDDASPPRPQPRVHLGRPRGGRRRGAHRRADRPVRRAGVRAARPGPRRGDGRPAHGRDRSDRSRGRSARP